MRFSEKTGSIRAAIRCAPLPTS